MRKVVFIFQTISLFLEKILKIIDKFFENLANYFEKFFLISSKTILFFLKIIFYVTCFGIIIWFISWIVSIVPSLFWIIFFAVLFALSTFYLLFKNK